MSSVGIIAEYNPFHNGHGYHIKQAKERSGAENAIVCMSASFTQRGEPACLDKFTRARLALLGGADMVIELPDILSCACAERFCRGGVRLLAGSGLIDALAFGSECGDIEAIKKAAEKNIAAEEMRSALSSGLSYPAAAAQALKRRGISIDASSPNDVLGIEYLRQLTRLAPGIEPIAIKRVGAGYNDTALESGFASASALRKAAELGELGSVSSHVPAEIYSELLLQSEKGRFPGSLEALSPAVLFALRTLGADGIRSLADVSEGLENPIYNAALCSSSLTELLFKVKTKRYTLARLRRILVYALLGTTAELQELAVNSDDALYIRVLGVKKEKLALLSELVEKADLPVVVAASDAEKLPKSARLVLAHTCRAALLHSLCLPKDKSCRSDLSHALITV